MGIVEGGGGGGGGDGYLFWLVGVGLNSSVIWLYHARS